MNEKISDIELLNLIRNGDESAFRRLFDTFFSPMCRFMHLYIADRFVVEELAMDIFVYIWLNRKIFRINISFKAYLFQAARNKCLNFLRKKELTLSLDQTGTDFIDTDSIDIETEELYQLLEEAVLALPERCKKVFQLSREENLTNQEIASKLNISVKTVEGQITKALKRIKFHLGDFYSYLW